MKTTITKFLFLFLLIAFGKLNAQTVNANYLDGQIWFKLKADAKVGLAFNQDFSNLSLQSISFIEQLADKYKISNLSKPFPKATNSPVLSNVYLVKFSDYSNVHNLIKELKLQSAVDYAERVPLPKTTLTPNDPSYASQQWGLTKINAASAWNYFSSGSTVVVAIVDNAVETTHPDLAPSLWVNTGEIASNGIDDDGNGYIDDINGYDVADDDNNPNPPSASLDHGTHVAGIVGAKTNNSIGIASIGFSVKLMAVKTATNSGTLTSGYSGLYYAALNKANVINMSWGTYETSVTVQSLVTWASQTQGCVLVAAAGNSNSNALYYPASYPEIISVAATESTDAKASYSNFGSWVTISAPGSNIYSTVYGGTYGNKSGTSMAAPMVAGLCGLMLSKNPLLTPADIKSCLTSTAVNIDAVNSSYIGNLGAGRIDANAAMACVSASLTWLPVADFSANQTSITQGGSVTYTNLSTYAGSAATYLWTFTGGTPSTSTLKTPPAIAYNTAGSYNVSLKVTNGNGNNTKTKTSYITVAAPTGCVRPNWPVSPTWTGTYYYSGSTYAANGWINGLNTDAAKEKAQYFDVSSSTDTLITRTYIGFSEAYSSNANKIVAVKVYNNSGAGGSPGTLLATQNITMGTIMYDENNNLYTTVYFNTPVTIPASRKFYISVDLTNLSWSGSPKDTLSMYSNTHGQTVPSQIWERHSDNLWYRYNAAGSYWAMDASLYIFPFTTSVPAVASYTPGSQTICEGASISFNASSSTAGSTFYWNFPGGAPATSGATAPSVLFNTPGTYTVVLYTTGGGCIDLAGAASTVTVNANPSLVVNASQTILCPSNTATITASGATSYIWSPATGLNTTTGSTVTASPTTTTTYNIKGTGANTCVSNSIITIERKTIPQAIVSAVSSSVCVGQSLNFDASQSTEVNTFSWTFQSGSPTSSISATPSVSWSSAGSYSVKLKATNDCGVDSSYILTVTAGCVGIDEQSSNNITAFYNNESQMVNINLGNLQMEGTKVLVYNSVGQLVYTEAVNQPQVALNIQHLSRGIYALQITNNINQIYSVKFIK